MSASALRSANCFIAGALALATLFHAGNALSGEGGGKEDATTIEIKNDNYTSTSGKPKKRKSFAEKAREKKAERVRLKNIKNLKKAKTKLVKKSRDELKKYRQAKKELRHQKRLLRKLKNQKVFTKNKSVRDNAKAIKSSEKTIIIVRGKRDGSYDRYKDNRSKAARLQTQIKTLEANGK